MMRKQEKFILLLLFLSILLSEQVQLMITNGSLSSAEYNGLYDLYQTTNGEYWNWRNITADSIPWNFTVYNPAAPCSDIWQGITCLCLNGSCHVQQLYLPSHNLSGTLPSTIGNFPVLTELDLGINNITGTLPEEIMNLKVLEILDLHGNQLIGSLPSSIGNLSALTSLLLWDNFLEGHLPVSVYDCTRLIALDIQYNQFDGSLTSSIENWANLTILNLIANKFTGSLPHEIGKLQNLSRFLIGANKFNGTIPKEFYSLYRLKFVYLSYNKFTGTLSADISNLKSLRIWECADNSFFGSLPATWFTSDIPMQLLELADNLFSGSINLIPNWKSTIQSIFINDNLFSGTISKDFNNIYVLFTMYVSNNFLNGTTEGLFENQSSLTLDAGNNMFTGSLPSSSLWKDLVNYVFSVNYLTGTFPTNLSHSHHLYYLDVGFNHLHGTLPQYFNSPYLFPRLAFLNFTSNYFSGGLENTFENITNLESFCVSSNQLTGTIPKLYNTLNRLSYLLLGDNQLTGTLSSSLRLLQNLKVLFLQNNRLSGTIRDTIEWSSVQIADLSNNIFTGSIYVFITANPTVEVFDGSSNCFHGTIPRQMCNVTSLTILSLDGLSTAKSCRSYIFPGSNLLTAFTLEDDFANGIPECLFTMPHLETLHLSGNGLTGSLPNHLQISDTLSDLTLSYNQLTGTIPSTFQERSWSNFDLSYNKLTGLLSPQIVSYSSNQSLSLQVNRLSGNIPNTLIRAANIDLLDGNMFACNYDHADLPEHDNLAVKYSCGSDVVNAVLYVWIIVVLCGMLFIILTRRCCERKSPSVGSKRTFTNDLIKYIFKVKTWRQNFNYRFNQSSTPTSSSRTTRVTTSTRKSSMNDTLMVNDYHRICKLSLFLQKVRFLFCSVTIFILGILMPVYGTLSLYYKTFRESYAWVLSSLLLSGRSAGIIMMIFYLITLLLLFVLFKVIISPSKSKRERIVSFKSHRISLSNTSKQVEILMTIRDSARNTFTEGNNENIVANSESRRSVPKEEFLKISYLSLAIVGLGDCLIMVFADFAYVYVILHYDTQLITIAEIFLALFKTLLNNKILWDAIPFVQNLIDPKANKKRRSEARTVDLQAGKTTKYKPRDLSFLSFLIFLNNLVFPAMVVLAVSSNCFNNAINDVPDVPLTYSYETCLRYSLVGSCLQPNLYTTTSSYSPPFFYSYQCASEIIITYASVFIVMFITEGFVLPLFRLTVKFLYDRELERMKLHRSFSAKSSNSSTSMSIVAASEDIQNSNSRPADEADTSTNSFLKPDQSSWYHRLLLAALPRNLRALTREPSSNIRDALVLFDKNRLVVKLNAYLVVFMTYGVLFPPLALIACVTTCLLTAYQETVIGRLFYESERTGYAWYRKQIDRNCSGVSMGLNHFLQTLVPSACVVYSYLVFDTWGDSEGWKDALPPSILMLVVPSLFFLAYSNRRLLYTLKERFTGRSATAGNTAADLGLSSLNPIRNSEQNSILTASENRREDNFTTKENTNVNVLDAHNLRKGSVSNRFSLTLQFVTSLPVFQPYDYEDSDDDENISSPPDDVIHSTPSITESPDKEIIHPRSSIPFRTHDGDIESVKDNEKILL